MIRALQLCTWGRQECQMQQMLTGGLQVGMKGGGLMHKCRMNRHCSVAMTIGWKKFKDLAL